MYIAFKWLIALALALWLGLCCFDIFVKESKRKSSDFMVKQYEPVSIYNNVSASIGEKRCDQGKEDWKYVKQNYDNRQSIAFLHYITFLAGVLAVSVFNKKNIIIKYAKKGLSTINVPVCPMSCDIDMFNNNFGALDFKRLVSSLSVAKLNYLNILWGNLKKLITNAMMPEKFNVEIANSTQNNNEIGQQPKKLGQLLLAAIEENKKNRLKYEMERTTKDKLVKYIGETHKSIKESRTQFASFQQLYLVTHRENIFLKSRIKKLTDDKDTAEKKLISLINEVYRSKDNALKAYCTRFIVHSKKNLLNSDVRAEIRKFLQKSQKAPHSENFTTEVGIKLSATSSLPECSSYITEVVKDDHNLLSVISNAPNLIGLPGEYVFTVKDKNGITKKLYEYKIDYNNDEEISNLRQYSVYEDKSCLLDQRSEQSSWTASNTSEEKVQVDLTSIKNQRFLTGSEEFKIFLRNSPVSLRPRIQMPALPCG